MLLILYMLLLVLYCRRDVVVNDVVIIHIDHGDVANVVVTCVDVGVVITADGVVGVIQYVYM